MKIHSSLRARQPAFPPSLLQPRPRTTQGCDRRPPPQGREQLRVVTGGPRTGLMEVTWWRWPGGWTWVHNRTMTCSSCGQYDARDTFRCCNRCQAAFGWHCRPDAAGTRCISICPTCGFAARTDLPVPAVRCFCLSVVCLVILCCFPSFPILPL
jgi:hypothetical protein